MSYSQANAADHIHPPDPVNTDNTSRSADINTEEMATMATNRPSEPLSLQTSGFPASDSPPHSASSSTSRKPSRSPLSIDISNVPALVSPAPPSNTLIITRLEDPAIFHPASLATIREHIAAIARLNSFSPLKSMSRIIVSFENEADAIKVRQEIDRTAFTPTNICKCYFGEPTPISDTIKYLEQPDSGRLFFISPPPSPPVGWESKAEDPPNKQVHADDLATKLTNLSSRLESGSSDQEAQYTADELRVLKSNLVPSSPGRKAMSIVSAEAESPTRTRSRSGTLIFDPKEHAESPGLPAVVLETEDDSDVELDNRNRSPMAHTMRPPVELMEQ